MAKAKELAKQMAARVSQGTLNKSYGARSEWESAFMPIAEAIVMLDKSLTKRGKRMQKSLAVNAQHLDDIEAMGQVTQPSPFQGDFYSGREVMDRTDRTVGISLRNIDSTLADYPSEWLN